MNSFFSQLWSAAVGVWRSLFLAAAICLFSTSLFAWIGILLVREKLSLSPPMIILLLVGIAASAWALVDLSRSAIRTVAGWRTRKIEAVEGVVAIGMLVVVVYVTTRNFYLWALSQ